VTPEERAEYRAKVQNSFYVNSVSVDEPVVVTAAVVAEEVEVTVTEPVDDLE